MSPILRKAVHADRPVIEDVISRSIRALGAGDYSQQQIDGALRGAFGVDTQLIDDRTYYVVELNDAIVACGGWSYRRTLFGGDAHTARNAAVLDPAVDAAKIRAFFVAPEAARQGIGAALLARCEADARAAGFLHAEMMATLPGVRLYAARGYVGDTPVEHPLGDGLSIRFVPMRKCLSDATSAAGKTSNAQAQDRAVYSNTFVS